MTEKEREILVEWMGSVNAELDFLRCITTGLDSHDYPSHLVREQLTARLRDEGEG